MVSGTRRQPAVLIVDDDESSRESLARLIGLYGYETTAVGTFGEGVELLETAPEFLILDPALPDGAGTDILQRIRQRDLPIKVAIATGTRDFQLYLDTLELKPEATFWKPLAASEILNWLKFQSPVALCSSAWSREWSNTAAV